MPVPLSVYEPGCSSTPPHRAIGRAMKPSDQSVVIIIVVLTLVLA
jgi:hypothetical protein